MKQSIKFTSDTKRFQIDAYQVLQIRYKDVERIHNTAKAATDIYEDLAYISTHGADPTAFVNIIEKARRWTIYGFIIARDINREAPDLTIKALKLPPTLKYLEASQEENKRMTFSRVCQGDCPSQIRNSPFAASSQQSIHEL